MNVVGCLILTMLSQKILRELEWESQPLDDW